MVSPAVTACSCFLTETFCQYTQDYFEWTEGKTVVARVKLLEFGNAYRQGYFPRYDLEILEVYAGEMQSGNRVSLLGQDGGNCNGHIPDTGEGDEYIVMFPNIPDRYMSYYVEENVDHPYPVFDLPGCGPSVLTVDRGRVNGIIAEGVRSVSLTEFRGALADCIGEEWVVPVGSDGRISGTVYPNPAREYVEVQLSTPSAVFSVSVYDVLGRLIFREELGGKVISEHTLSVANLPAGGYVLVMEMEGIRVKEQIIVY